MKINQKTRFFLLGGAAYTGLELLWRGRSHVSMFLLGGGCFLGLGRIGKSRMPVAAQPVMGSLLVTAGELATGLLVNRNFTVWDYRRVPFQFLGQICLPYSLLWMPVSFAGIALYRWVEGKWP